MSEPEQHQQGTTTGLVIFDFDAYAYRGPEEEIPTKSPAPPSPHLLNPILKTYPYLEQFEDTPCRHPKNWGHTRKYIISIPFSACIFIFTLIV